jgi:acetyl esterase/lipase
MLMTLGALAAIALVLGLSLQFAIARNGPAVLTAVDRLAGGDGDAELKASLSFGEDPAQQLLIWGPATSDAEARPLPVILFSHGGSWRSGNPVDYGFFARAFVPKGFVVALAGYRLHPQAEYPAMLEDTARAIALTHREIGQYGGDPARITLAGHSAGAYNVVMAGLEEQWLDREGLSTQLLSGVVGLSGPYDFYPFDSESTINSFGNAAEPEETQPINHVRADAPPVLLIHGEQDTLVKPRNSRVLASGLEEQGAEVTLQLYPSMNHNDPLVSLAAPWRNSRDIDDLIARFAENPDAF